jgi:hypothetical protein
MADLRTSSDVGEVAAPENFGPAGTGAGVDVMGELERVRNNLLALVEVLEELRSRYNGHSHGGAVPAPPIGEQAQQAFTVY